MHTPVEIEFQEMAASDQLSAAIRKRADKLEKFCQTIVGCHVVVHAVQDRHELHSRFRVHIRLELPGRTLEASHEPEAHGQSNALGAIKGAFDTLQRTLTVYMRGLSSPPAPPAEADPNQRWRKLSL